jgi:hypothetical protein
MDMSVVLVLVLLIILIRLLDGRPPQDRGGR